MKTKIISLVVASMLLTSVANAGQGFIALGYGSANVDSETAQGGVTLEFGAKFGETFKQTIATKLIFIGENDDWSDGQGNLGDIYYSLGFELLPSTILSAKVGMGFQSLGSVGVGRNATEAYSIGLSYGAIATYELSEHFDISASYTQMDLSYMELDYKIDIMDVSIAYKF
jgi:hypothetical protein